MAAFRCLEQVASLRSRVQPRGHHYPPVAGLNTTPSALLVGLFLLVNPIVHRLHIIVLQRLMQLEIDAGVVVVLVTASAYPALQSLGRSRAVRHSRYRLAHHQLRQLHVTVATASSTFSVAIDFVNQNYRSWVGAHMLLCQLTPHLGILYAVRHPDELEATESVPPCDHQQRR